MFLGNPCDYKTSNEIEGICQVGFGQGHMGMLRERCGSDLVQMGCTGMAWGRRLNSDIFGGKSCYWVVRAGDGAIGLPRPFKVGWHKSSIVRRSGTGKSPPSEEAYLEDQSLDDFFNNLKIYEAELKSSSSTSHTTQNIAFISSHNTDNTNESVSVVASVFAASTKPPASILPNVDNLSDVFIYSFFASQSNSPQLDNDDLKQSMLMIWRRWISKEVILQERAGHLGTPGIKTLKEEMFQWRLLLPMLWCHSVMLLVAMIKAFRLMKNQQIMPSWHLPPPAHQILIMSSESDESVPTSPMHDRYKSDPSQSWLGSPKDIKFLFDVQGNPQQALKNKVVIDSGFSRHMTGNISYLSDFKEINGGYVAFGGNPKGGKITSKEQYFLMTDYSLWEVILNGDSPTPTRVVDGVVQAVAPTTAEQRLAKKNELKARGTLLMALLNKHQLKFNTHKDAKSLMEAIEKSVSAASTKPPAYILPNVDNLSDVVIYSFFARFDMSKVVYYNCHRRGHFAKECRSPRDTRNKDTQRRNVPVETSTLNAWLISSKSDVNVPTSSVHDRTSIKLAEHPTPPDNLRKDIPKSIGYKHSWNRKACFVCKSLNHLIKDCDYHEKKMVQKHVWNHSMRVNHHNSARMTHPHSKKHVVPIAVLTRSRLVPLNAARPVTTAVPQPNVKYQRPAIHVVNKPHLAIRRSINYRSSPKNSNFHQKVTTVKAKQGNPQQALKDKRVINSGCSRHMTGNISYLSNFEEINRGYVAFGGNLKGGKIIGKGKIRIGKLDFDDVYLVKELKFNPFSVSQMCDKKNSVLFTNTKCIILSSYFKLLDENYVLLRVPRENNMYNVDLKNIVHSGDLTCLFAKATLDESDLWHKRLGHINFKTMNKLVKGNLVRGLRSKVFKNNQTCIVCKKGKQNRASCKSKPVSSVSQPLQRVLVTKPHNKTPYELLLGRTPSIGFMRPFGCPVTILNTLDPLRKFNGKADEGFLVGYSVSSNAFRVFNSRTRIVHESLHINFLENQPDVARRSGPTWLFDIDTLTQSMNYQPVVVGNQPNHTAGIQENLMQDEGKDYEQVFALVASFEAIRLFLAYAFFMGFMVYQMDVKSAFLYGTIEEEVYVYQSLGFKDPDCPHKVYKVVKALYGLHQAPRAWYETLANYFLENGFQRGKIDQTLSIKNQKGDILLVQVYVDDIILDLPIKTLKQKEDRIFISQDKYVAKILRKFGLTNEKSASTPIDTKKPLLKDPDGKDVDIHTYSDYARASLDRKSITGGCQFLGCRLISWQCKKQTVVVTSSTEVKYVAVASCCAQVLWIQNQLLDYGNKALAIPGQTTTGKENSNPFMVDSLPKTILLTFIHGTKVSAVSTDCGTTSLFHESPLLGVNTPRSDEDSLEFMELMDVEDAVEDEDNDHEVSAEPIPPSPKPATPPPSPTQEPIPSPPQAQTAQPSSPPP
uniref:Ribonuclease H-like domain-containing protein n=1 Tax=Tanacetum cinerariifolium TaxID=118510 RepID=A0A6L2KBT6_TANCI|nr:ribonuclease H-like domain-containing protein [Tanacetum cinerariifolium]